MRRFPCRPIHAALWLGLVALAAGAVLVVIAPPSSFGSFGFASFSSEPTEYAYVAGVRPWQLVVGPVLVLVGAVVAAFAAGRLSAGRRR